MPQQLLMSHLMLCNTAHDPPQNTKNTRLQLYEYQNDDDMTQNMPFCTRANSLPGANRPIGPWPIRSQAIHTVARLLPATFALGNFRSLELSFSGTFTPIMCISPFIEQR